MDDRDPSGRFVRGLTLGVLLGAIIAGSSMWRRSKAARTRGRIQAPPDPMSPSAGGPAAPTTEAALDEVGRP